MNSKSKFFVVVLAILVIATLIVRHLGGQYVKLSSAPPLSGVVAQSLDLAGGTTIVPVAGKAFSLQNVSYFDNNDWVIATVSPSNGNTTITQALVVLQKKDGTFQVVLGPGTDFDSSYLTSLPADVGQSLEQQGVISEFSYQ
jgi:hypothetical protein